MIAALPLLKQTFYYDPIAINQIATDNLSHLSLMRINQKHVKPIIRKIKSLVYSGNNECHGNKKDF